MQNLPKIVREQLKAGTAVANHPDADVLTAFAEKSLPAMERDGVLEHLARCHDCRDIVALALPETEAGMMVVPVRSGWLAWPALRWGFAAAGVVLVASLGIVQFKQRSQTAAMVAKSRPELTAYIEGRPSAAPATPAADAEENRDTVALTTPSTSATNDGKKEADRSQLIAHSPAPPLPPAQFHSGLAGAAGGMTAGAAQFGPRAPVQSWQQQQTARVQARPAPSSTTNQQADMASNLNVPSPSTTVEVASAAPQITTETTGEAASQPLDFRDSMSKAKAPVRAESPTGFPQKLEGDKEPQELPVAHNDVTGRNVKQLDRNSLGLMCRWTISPVGVLRRSFDQGNTWQDIDVDATASAGAVAQAAKGAAVAAKTDLAREKSADVKQSTPIVFRAFTANGRDVWAGGSNSALYHSTDTGNHWTRILPQSDGVALTGDIVSIQFTDLQHGGVLTSTGETWTTSDSGQTWRKQ